MILIMFCSGMAILSAQESNTQSEYSWNMQHVNFFGLTVQTGFSSAMSAENIGAGIDLMINGPEVLFGIILLEKGVSTHLELEIVKSIDFTGGMAVLDEAAIPLPDLLITPRLLFLLWVGNLGIGWGSSFSMVVSQWTYLPRANFVYAFANVQLVMPIDLGESRLPFTVVAELGLHWQNLRNTENTAANIGFQGSFGGRLYFPFDSE